LHHGGDIYRNKVNIDFSISINPLGVPSDVIKAMERAVRSCSVYPDIRCERLTQKLSDRLKTDPEFIVIGNGSSEIFTAVSHVLNDPRTLIAVPSFKGYERAFSIYNKADYYHMTEEDGFGLTDKILELINEKYDYLLLANPNNPTGAVIKEELLIKIIEKCSKENVRLILDECFIDFVCEGRSMLSYINKYSNLCIIRSFTKIYSIASVRLGYMICSDLQFVQKVRKHLPEWNVSGIAQAAGVACLDEYEHQKKCAYYVKEANNKLTNDLNEIGIETFPSYANYILFRDERPLFDELLSRGILIRDCSDFRGLNKGYFRTAVKTFEENDVLIEALREICLSENDR